MTFNRTAIFICVLAGVIAGCAAPPAPPVSTLQENPASSTQSNQDALKLKYAELTKNAGRVFKLDPQQSSVRIYVFRAGAAARLGHNHVLSAPKFTGFAYLPAAGTNEAQFDLQVRLDELDIDNPAIRSQLGKAFATVPSATDIAGTRANMLGEKNMQAERFPFVRLQSLRIVGEAPKFAAEVQVEMHGVKREIRIPLSVEGLPDNISVSGAFTLRQTDFGVQPFSVFNGLVAVADEVVIEFKLVDAP